MQKTLPPLRQDISLHEGPAAQDGSPTFSIYDPVRSQYFRVGWQEFELLSRWDTGDPEKLLERVNTETTLTVNEAQLEALVRFLNFGNLIQLSPDISAATLQKMKEATKNNKLVKYLKSYLFFKIPLVRPDQFLQRTLDFVKPLYSRLFFTLSFFVALFGLFLIGRQWEAFKHTFMYYFNMQGLVYFFITIFVVKIFHELGHAYTAKRYGCKIPTMGVVFLVFWPVFYTDTTDAWRLTSKKQRLYIAAAGVFVELIFAAYATLLWTFLPEGMFKSMAFFVATTSWIFSIVLNANPFLRFDGYYLLADWMDISNLQVRAFAIGKWQIRHSLFGLKEQLPYAFNKKTHLTLMFYAYATWIYRFFLMFGIALVVYYLFFKLLGLLLMLAALSLFLIAPIAKELSYYWDKRKEMDWNRKTRLTALGVGIVIFLLVIPWRNTIVTPGLLEFQEHTKLYAPEGSQVVKLYVRNNDMVQEGQILIKLKSDDIDYKIGQAQIEAKILEYRVRTELGQTETYGIRQADQAELSKKISELRGLEELKKELTITAPFTGVVTNVAPDLIETRWVRKNNMLLELVNADEHIITAYVPEKVYNRLKKDKVARFHPENLSVTPVIRARIKLIDQVTTQSLTEPYLASRYGGDLAVHEGGTELFVKDAMYRVTLVPEGGIRGIAQVARGKVQFRTSTQSILWRAWVAFSAILIRESGF